MFLQETDLNVVPGGIIPVMHVSQYDVGRELKFVLYSGYDYASLESGTTVTIEGTKPDGHGFQYSGVLDQNTHTATFVTTEQMTVLAGAIECKLTLYLNSQRIGTALFILDVEKAGINDSTIISDTELPLIIAQATEQMERAEAAADAAALSETNAATSETNAAASETNAANSEIICGSFMRMAGASAASAEQSAIISGSFMRTAGNFADGAEASAASANVDALKSEGHALGTQNGTPVSSDSPYYRNNAKYWADEARQSSAGGVAASVIATAEPTNISSHAYAIGDQFVYNGILYTATSAISVGATITPGTNCSISDTITEQIGNAGHTILDEDGTTYPQRSKLQFEGAIVSDDETNDTTIVETVNPVEYEEDIYGVNLLNVTASTQITKGMTFTVNADKSVTINGTSSDGESVLFYFIDIPGNVLKEKLGGDNKQIIASSFCPPGGTPTTYFAKLTQTSPSYHIVFEDDGNGSSFNTNDIDDNGLYRCFTRFPTGTTIDNVTIYPMLYDARFSNPSYRGFNDKSIQNQITEQTNVLGAKNLLPYPYGDTTKTTNGVTFTVMEDGTVIANGTATKASFFNLLPGVFSNNVYKGCIFTGLTSEGSKSTFYLIADYSETGSSWKIGDSGYGLDGLIIRDYPYVQLHLYIPVGATVTNLIFKPMLRLASDPDDTYVPYAMTNRELTDAMADSGWQTCTLATGFSGNIKYRQIGKVVMVTGMDVTATATGSKQTLVQTLPTASMSAFAVAEKNGGVSTNSVYIDTNTAILKTHVVTASEKYWFTLIYFTA